MSNPVVWTMSCLEWYTFRMPGGRRYDTNKLMYVKIDNSAILTWLKENVKGKWALAKSVPSGVSIPVFIKDKQDAMLFKLAWSDSTVKLDFRF